MEPPKNKNIISQLLFSKRMGEQINMRTNFSETVGENGKKNIDSYVKNCHFKFHKPKSW